jgi:hypothetical protein
MVYRVSMSRVPYVVALTPLPQLYEHLLPLINIRDTSWKQATSVAIHETTTTSEH